MKQREFVCVGLISILIYYYICGKTNSPNDSQHTSDVHAHRLYYYSTLQLGEKEMTRKWESIQFGQYSLNVRYKLHGYKLYFGFVFMSKRVPQQRTLARTTHIWQHGTTATRGEDEAGEEIWNR